MIRLQNLCMHCMMEATRIDILREIDLDVAADERIAIARPSGSGKTSLLRLAEPARPTSGRAFFDGSRSMRSTPTRSPRRTASPQPSLTS